MSVGGVPIAVVMKISPIFDILIVTLVMFFWVTIERFRTYSRLKVSKLSFMEDIKGFLSKRRYDEAIEFCSRQAKPLPGMLGIGLTNRNRAPEDIAELMEASRMSERVKLEAWLPILGTLGNSAPFIGLLGTVIGIIRAFKLLEHAGAGGATTIMVGIAEALVTTAMGLIVAIPCVMAFNYFMGVVKNWYVEMEVASKELLVELVGKEKAEKAIKRVREDKE